MTNHPVTVRAAVAEDLEPFLQTLCAAFGIDADAARPLFYKDPFFDLSHKRVLLTPEDGLVSCLTVIPASLGVGGTFVPTGGIAGVATRPRCRHRGHAGRLLSETVSALSEELHYPVSALFPFQADFYRRFGWETASRVAHWTGATRGLPAFSEAASVLPVAGDEDRQRLHALHAGVTQSRTGAFERDSRRWAVIENHSPGRRTVVSRDPSGRMSGYLLYEARQDAPEGVLVIHEMHGLDDFARRGLLGFLSSQQSQFPKVEWEASQQDLQMFGLLSPGSPSGNPPQFTLKPGMMLRIVNLRAALQRVHATIYGPVLADAKASLTIRAFDALLLRNEVPQRLTAAEVETGTGDDRDWIAADIRALAQLYLGYRTPSEASASGHLTASSPMALALADRLFPARRPYVAPPDQF